MEFNQESITKSKFEDINQKIKKLAIEIEITKYTKNNELLLELFDELKELLNLQSTLNPLNENF
jgi:hypothetical protein